MARPQDESLRSRCRVEEDRNPRITVRPRTSPARPIEEACAPRSETSNNVRTEVIQIDGAPLQKSQARTFKAAREQRRSRRGVGVNIRSRCFTRDAEHSAARQLPRLSIS